MRASVILVSLLLGCSAGASSPSQGGGSQAGPTPPEPASHKPAATPAVPASIEPRIVEADQCAPESTMLDEPHVCLKLPAEYERVREAAGHIEFAAEDGPAVHVRWTIGSDAFAREHRAALQRLAQQDPTAIVGPTRDGSGSFVYASESQPGVHGPTAVLHAASVLRDPNGVVVTCAVDVVSAPPPERALLEACQTIMAR